MNDFEKTIVVENPEYVGQPLLLTDAEKKRLFKTPKGHCVEVMIDSKGVFSVNEISTHGRREQWSAPSLRHLGKQLFGFDDPSVSQMLNFLVLPMMEVERIFNAIRYKYLQSVYEAEPDSTGAFFSSSCNKAFQALAGFPVYQGGKKIRISNDEFFQKKEFRPPSDTGITFKEERENLDFILKYLRRLHLRDYGKIYLELIGIKPGFHELWTHGDFYDIEGYPKSDKPRDQVLAFLRGVGDGHNFSLPQLPNDIKKNKYITYAACAVTEGPFVFRKNLSVTYFEAIRKITKSEDKKKLLRDFHIYDYNKNKINSKQELAGALKETARYMTFSPMA